jgi:hypothetical protein
MSSSESDSSLLEGRRNGSELAASIEQVAKLQERRLSFGLTVVSAACFSGIKDGSTIGSVDLCKKPMTRKNPIAVVNAIGAVNATS